MQVDDKIMMKFKLVAFTLSGFLLFHSHLAHSIDAGFRYQAKNNRCENSDGKQGFNPNFFGECGSLVKANLSRTYLNGIQLKRANLSKTNFFRANLRNANLKGAQMDRADLTACDLRGADLRGAKLEGAFLSRAIIDEFTKLPFDLAEAKKRGMRFTPRKRHKKPVTSK